MLHVLLIVTVIVACAINSNSLLCWDNFLERFVVNVLILAFVCIKVILLSFQIWCRQHLFTPCCHGDRLLKLPKAVATKDDSVKLKQLAADLLNADRKFQKCDVKEEEDIIDVTFTAGGSLLMFTSNPLCLLLFFAV